MIEALRGREDYAPCGFVFYRRLPEGRGPILRHPLTGGTENFAFGGPRNPLSRGCSGGSDRTIDTDVRGLEVPTHVVVGPFAKACMTTLRARLLTQSGALRAQACSLLRRGRGCETTSLAQGRGRNISFSSSSHEPAKILTG